MLSTLQRKPKRKEAPCTHAPSQCSWNCVRDPGRLSQGQIHKSSLQMVWFSWLGTWSRNLCWTISGPTATLRVFVYWGLPYLFLGTGQDVSTGVGNGHPAKTQCDDACKQALLKDWICDSEASGAREHPPSPSFSSELSFLNSVLSASLPAPTPPSFHSWRNCTPKCISEWNHKIQRPTGRVRPLCFGQVPKPGCWSPDFILFLIVKSALVTFLLWIIVNS